MGGAQETLDLPLTEAGDPSSENARFSGIDQILGRILQSGSPVDWQESRRWCGEVLGPLIQASADTRRLTKLLEGTRFMVGGDEHDLVEVDRDPDRVYKLTRGNNFGCRPTFYRQDPEMTGKHFHGTGNADPFFYLRRWWLLNQLSGYQTRFEGFLPAEHPGWVPRICISQPKIEGSNPPITEIGATMANFNFLEISQEAYLQKETLVLLTDMAPRNVRIVGGVPVPFDAIALLAPPDVLDWVNSGTYAARWKSDS